MASIISSPGLSRWPSLIACFVVACATEDPSSTVADRTTERRVIHVDEPTAIFFFPHFDSIAPDDGVGSAADHLSVAVHVMEGCLERKGITVEWVETWTLIVENAGKSDRLDLSVDSESEAGNWLGCYLASPGRPPAIVRGTTGPSSLIVLCPAAASTYFDVPECCPEGFRCCADGSVVCEEMRCGSR